MNNKNSYIVLINSSDYNVVLFNTNTLKALLLLQSSIFSRIYLLQSKEKVTTSSLLVITYCSSLNKDATLVNTFYTSLINYFLKGIELILIVNTFKHSVSNFIEKVFTNKKKATGYYKKSISRETENIDINIYMQTTYL